MTKLSITRRLSTAIFFAGVLVLGACNAPSPRATPQSKEAMAAVAAAAAEHINKNRPKPNSKVRFRGARAEGHVLQMQYTVTGDEVLNILRSNSGLADQALSILAKRDLCKEATTRLFLDAGLAVQLIYFDSQNKLLAKGTVDRC